MWYLIWEDLLIGVTQRSVLGLLLFNMFMCDLVLVMANYTDDMNLYDSQNNLFDVQRKLESESTKHF